METTIQEQLTLHCENRIDGILTAIYDAFVYKNRMRVPYKDTITIQIGDGLRNRDEAWICHLPDDIPCTLPL